MFLQETWLSKQELSNISSLHPDFYGRGVAAYDDSNGLLVGRPYGGLAILWRKTLGTICKVSDVGDERLLLLELTSCNGPISLLNVYLPYDNGNNLDDYRFYLAKVKSYLSHPCSVAIGVFNANVKNNNSRFA